VLTSPSGREKTKPLRQAIANPQLGEGVVSDCRRPSLSSCYAGLVYRAGAKWRAEGSPQLRLQGDTVVHHSVESLYPDWSGEEQSRAYSYDGDELVLRTPLMQGAVGTVVNELHWVRA
jgi:Lipocalin-like domain